MEKEEIGLCGGKKSLRNIIIIRERKKVDKPGGLESDKADSLFKF